MQLRREFLDPFFEALGWDVANRHSAIDLYKEVVHDESLHFGGKREAPDYTFKFGGRRLFFAEAKRPGIDLLKSADAAYQIRSYGWNAKLPLCVLSNFGQFLVFDCRRAPKKGDAADEALVAVFEAKDYQKKWDQIAELFARDAVLGGSLEKARSAKRRVGRNVDTQLLDDIERWRELLAKDVAAENALLTVRSLAYCVSMLIDRIVFLKICEDRGLEPEGQLLEAATTGDSYKNLFRLFYNAERKYGSSLFHFTSPAIDGDADDLTPRLRVDDRVVQRIIRELYVEYDFAIIPPEILGAVYERFLSKRIRLTSAHQAKIELKPEFRKRHGVYYTPVDVVERMLAQSLDMQLKTRDLRSIRDFRIVDPACGSGSFLLAAYQHLLDWYLGQYLLQSLGQTRARIFQVGPTGWALTLKERTRILRQHIFGLDIDPQAVEVTKLSLLLKVLETPDRAALSDRPQLIQEPLLPGLDSNIECGNALVGSDFFSGQQLSLIDDERRYTINPFDWSTFSANRGFDLVIGNPPYVLLQGEFRDDELRAYLTEKFTVAAFKIDLYHLFFERAVALAADRGSLCLITPTNYLTNNYLTKLRRLLISQGGLRRVTIIDGNVFPDAAVDTAISYGVKGQLSPIVEMIHVTRKKGFGSENLTEIPTGRVLEHPYALLTGGSDVIAALWSHLAPFPTLSSAFQINFGKQLRDRDIFGDDVLQLEPDAAPPRGYERCLTGDNVERYAVAHSGLVCRTSRDAMRGGCWDAAVHDAVNKILCRQIGRTPEFALDEEGLACLNTVFMLTTKRRDVDPYAMLAVLNSRLIAVLWADRYYDQRATFPKVKGSYLKRLPTPHFDSTKWRDTQPELTKLAKRLMSNAARQVDGISPFEQRHRLEETRGLQARVDSLVWDLYGLTQEHILAVRDYRLPLEEAAVA